MSTTVREERHDRGAHAPAKKHKEEKKEKFSWSISVRGDENETEVGSMTPEMEEQVKYLAERGNTRCVSLFAGLTIASNLIIQSRLL